MVFGRHFGENTPALFCLFLWAGDQAFAEFEFVIATGFLAYLDPIFTNLPGGESAIPRTGTQALNAGSEHRLRRIGLPLYGETRT